MEKPCRPIPVSKRTVPHCNNIGQRYSFLGFDVCHNQWHTDRHKGGSIVLACSDRRRHTRFTERYSRRHANHVRRCTPDLAQHPRTFASWWQVTLEKVVLLVPCSSTITTFCKMATLTLRQNVTSKTKVRLWSPPTHTLSTLRTSLKSSPRRASIRQRHLTWSTKMRLATGNPLKVH